MKNFGLILSFIFIILIFPSINTAQTFGFGCLGLSGFYGGYSYYQYDAGGLTQSLIANINSSKITESDVKFSKGKGFRVGANLFRAKFDNFFLSAKGFYQFLKEQKEIDNPNYANSTQSEYTLVLNHWGVAVDIGIPLFSIVDFKIVEGGVTFYNVSFTDKTIVSGKVTNEKKYEPDKTNISYYVGSGLIVHIIPDYISVEGTAFYNFLKIDKINYQNNTAVLPNGLVKENLISKGGFSAALQLNVGFPL